MRKAINAAFIKDKKILLVKKKDVWILPGGKPEANESDLECLFREVKEEIRTGLENLKYYGEFEGITPHKKDTLKAIVYFADVIGEPKASAEIINCRWIKYSNNCLFSDITSKILNSLKKDNYL